MAALALVAFAPLVLFSESGVGLFSRAPYASREVARVTAPPLEPTHRSGPTSGGASSPQTGGSSGATASSVGTAGGIAGETATKRGGGPVFRGGDSSGGEVAQPEPGEGKDEGKVKGKARSHAKAKHHGKAKGHSKAKHHRRIAFAAPRAAQPGYVHPSRTVRPAGRSARAHARARR